ncbi:malonate transporter subunit MadL [Arundinibacter roseus]|uniref:Malonate transporter subunit MadL n=1 Tax=Arundinibacter roseus TaxID=2070510 RepID=A0A4R4K4T1_9BACT|nr:malonate transporter subunit MadL [Arundinibacter roseus]TDB61119.1 malonate transporter subunit MadL [Arundinibacter roseus]
MIIYGVALLAFCYTVGQLLGDYLGNLLGVQANVGGVGFAMLFLVVLSDWLRKKGALTLHTENGIQFWNHMYIPIIVAMAATQNVKLAVSSGFIALAAGFIPVVLGMAALPLLTRLAKKTQ